jgi:hypothetical protein
MAEKHSAPPTSYNAVFHGLGRNPPIVMIDCRWLQSAQTRSHAKSARLGVPD